MEIKQKSEYWQFRKLSFLIHTLGFGIVCLVAGFGICWEFLKDPTPWAFIPTLAAILMALWKYWKAAYKERIKKEE